MFKVWPNLLEVELQSPGTQFELFDITDKKSPELLAYMHPGLMICSAVRMSM
jgi:hypothetical protein